MVGGYTPEKVALRRAIFLAYDVQREIDQVYRGSGIRAQSMINPLGSGYDPAFRSDAGSAPGSQSTRFGDTASMVSSRRTSSPRSRHASTALRAAGSSSPSR